MARLNLLPWRDELRAQKNREFGVLTGIAAAAALGVVVLLSLYYAALIDHQQGRNRYLQAEIAKMDKKIESIMELRAKRERLQKRIETIQQLQTNRTEVVHLFYETAARVPDGVYLTAVQQSGAQLTISGVADSNGRVSEFAANINDSEWMTDPQINEITRNNTTALRTNNFKITLKQTRPGAGNAQDEDDQ